MTLDIDSWCGPHKDACSKVSVKVIQADAECYHIVRVLNLKTISLHVSVEGRIVTEDNRAMFQGPQHIVLSERNWKDSLIVFPTRFVSVVCFDKVRLLMKSPGRDVVETEVTYGDPWDPRRQIRACEPLEFEVELRP
jgi:hypothetical protein